MTTVVEQLRRDCVALLRHSELLKRRSLKRTRGQSPLDAFLCTGGGGEGGAEEEDNEVGTGLDGDDIIRRVHQNIVEHMKVTRSQFQSLVHERIINTLLHMIYNADWERHRDRILRYRRVQGRHKRFLIVSAARREGKTWTLTMVVAALLDLVPIRIVVFSISKRVSGWFMEQVQRFYFMLPGSRDRVAENNKETFTVSPTGQLHHPQQSTLICLPNSERSRGISADLVIFEEAQFMPAAQIQNVGAPLFRMGKTSVVAISSSGEDRNNLMQRLMDEHKDKPDSIYDILSREHLCAECTKAKKLECPHKILEVPAWISADKDEEVKDMYAGNTTRYQRELLGMSVSDDTDAFQFDEVQMAFDKPRLTFDTSPIYVFHCIDTSGGGSGSDTAWVSLAFTKTHDCVVSPLRNKYS
jgi:hypothetical protein